MNEASIVCQDSIVWQCYTLWQFTWRNVFVQRYRCIWPIILCISKYRKYAIYTWTNVFAFLQTYERSSDGSKRHQVSILPTHIIISFKIIIHQLNNCLNTTALVRINEPSVDGHCKYSSFFTSLMCYKNRQVPTPETILCE